MMIDITKEDIATLVDIVNTELNNVRLTISLPSSLGDDYKTENRKYADYLQNLIDRLNTYTK